MKKIFALVLMAGLVLAGCAEKTAMVEQAPQEPAPPVVVTPPPAPAPAEIVAVEVPAPKAERTVEKIFFAFNSHLLTTDSKEALESNALWLQEKPEIRIVIEGYTDERGSSSYNLALGDKRAQAARAYLVKLGIAPERLDVVSYGKEKAQEASDEAIWALDRRAEFVQVN